MYVEPLSTVVNCNKLQGSHIHKQTVS